MESRKFAFKSILEEGIHIPNKPAKCTWARDLHKIEKSPHSKQNWKSNTTKVLPDILGAVGNTPMVKLNKIPKSEDIECDIYGKCEFLNPAGSIKDRFIIRYIDDAEKSGNLKPGTTIISLSSGNSGIGLAWACAVKGYKCIIVMADTMSKEKEDQIRALGGDVVRVNRRKQLDSPEGMFGVLHLLYKQTPNAIILDQFTSPSNPLTHYDTTAEEILDQCDGQLDMIVLACGSGGTMSGISRKIKEKSPQTIIIGIDPFGSKYAQPDSLNESEIKFCEVEGVGFKYIPTVLDRSMVEKWYKLEDKESFDMARRLIKEEGLLVGPVSGLLTAGAIKAIKDFKIGKGKKVVVLLTDGMKSYLSKFVRDEWLEQKGLMPCINSKNHWWWDLNVTDIDYKPFINITTNHINEEVLDFLDTFSVDYLPVVENNGNCIGVVIRRNIINKLISGECILKDGISTTMDSVYSKLTSLSNLGLVSRVLKIENYVIILNSTGGIDKPIGILTSEDIFRIIKHKKVF